MWRIARTALAARWRRLLLTATAVVLGVAFVTGALVLTDTSSAVFDDQFAEASAGVDLVVRSRAAFGAAMGVEVERDPVPADVVDQVRALPGVAAVAGKVAGSALLVVDGEPVVPQGPSLGLSWEADPFNPFVLRTGRPPAAAGEVVVDAATAAAQSVAVGDRVAVQVERGQEPATVVGIAGFGDRDGLPQATAVLVTSDVAQDLFEVDDGVTEVQVATDAPAAEVRDRLVDVLGDRYEVASAQDTAAASADAAKDQLGYVKTMLLVLAGTALLVGALLIANTFRIVVAQRTRELALLRAVGATGRQVRAAVLTEAAAVGLVASLVGTGVGVAAAVGLRALVAATGVDLPGGGLVVAPRTVVVAMVVGLTVTLVSAFAPARRAARIAPVTALREATVVPAPSRRRSVVGALLGVAGVAALVASVVAGSLSGVGLAAALVLVALALLAPRGVGRLVAVVGAPFARRGAAGRLARASAAAAPRRTAATATALALGLAVVTFMTVVATSVKASMASGFDDVVTADAVVESSRGEMLGGLSPTVLHHVLEQPEVAVASPLRYGHWLDDGATSALTAVDPETLPDVMALDLEPAVLDGLSDGGILLTEGAAAEHGVGVGDDLAMTLPRTGEQRLEVVGTFADDDAWALSTDYVIALGAYGEHFGEDVDASVMIRFADGVVPADGLAAVRDAVAEFPTADVRDPAQAAAARTASVDSVLALVTVLLLLAVAVALLGVANTLGLSIVERTREIGLLRAVGAVRRQVGATVRLEALLVALVGGVAGVTVGLGLGIAATLALAGDMTLGVAVPVAQLLAFVGLAAAGGYVAGLLPARRAARLDVLAAIDAG